MKNITFLTLTICLLTGFSQVLLAAPAVKSHKYDNKSNTLKIIGKSFGNKCASCEVIGQYEKFNYALPVLSWNNKSITVKVPNFGSPSINYSVNTLKGRSKSKVLESIRPTETKMISRLIKSGSKANIQLYEYLSDSKLGDKGSHKYSVSSTPLKCNSSGYIFRKANLVVGKRTRFAKAAISSVPDSGCKNCDPLTVKYYIEPTGRLQYQVHVYREKMDGICKNRVRK